MRPTGPPLFIRMEYMHRAAGPRQIECLSCWCLVLRVALTRRRCVYWHMHQRRRDLRRWFLRAEHFGAAGRPFCGIGHYQDSPRVDTPAVQRRHAGSRAALYPWSVLSTVRADSKLKPQGELEAGPSVPVALAPLTALAPKSARWPAGGYDSTQHAHATHT